MKDARQPMRQRVLPCTCIETIYPGNVRTMMCEKHHREHFAAADRCNNNRDLVEASNLDLVGG